MYDELINYEPSHQNFLERIFLGSVGLLVDIPSLAIAKGLATLNMGDECRNEMRVNRVLSSLKDDIAYLTNNDGLYSEGSRSFLETMEEAE